MKAPAPPPLTIGKACPLRWDDLRGDAKRRYCEQCQLHVHNLSAMSRKERDRFVKETGGRACIAYHLNTNGTLRETSLWSRVTWPLQQPKAAALSLLATLLPFLFSACSQTECLQPTMGVPLPPPATDESGEPGVKKERSDR